MYNYYYLFFWGGGESNCAYLYYGKIIIAAWLQSKGEQRK